MSMITTNNRYCL